MGVYTFSGVGPHAIPIITLLLWDPPERERERREERRGHLVPGSGTTALNRAMGFFFAPFSFEIHPMSLNELAETQGR